MALRDVEDAIRHGCEVIETHFELVSQHENYTRYTIIDPIIWALGWETHNPDQCEVEYQRGKQGRVDYALFDREHDPVILIEAKRLDKRAINFERQVAGYARGMRSGACVLTDGQEWHLYDLSVRGRFKDKYVTTVDIYSQGTRQAAQTLNRALSKRNWW